jgi:hypothetical protein
VKDFALHQLFRDFLAESPLLKTSKLESVCDKHSTKAMYFIHRAFSSNAEPTKVRIVCLSSVKFHECLEGYLLLLLGYIFFISTRIKYKRREHKLGAALTVGWK